VYDIFGYLSVSLSSGIVLEFEPEFSKLKQKSQFILGKLVLRNMD